MVLADALSLASAKKPRAIIDYATLTGACVHALTERYSGAFTNRPEARALIESAGASSGERVWCFPMDVDFDTDLESSVADIMQCAAGTRHGGLGHIATEITGFGVRYTLDLLRSGWPAAPKASE
jgi:leucyl aminopeptidase